MGLAPGKHFKMALEVARNAEADGLPRAEITGIVMERFGAVAQIKKLSLGVPKPVNVACRPENEEEEINLDGSLSKMRELTQVPVVERAALMPDNCPSGMEWGSIPVGGAIVTKNSVIPAAHSADVNCGMWATFFKDGRMPVRDLMVNLAGSTVFGPYPAPRGEENPHNVLLEEVWDNPFLSGLEDAAVRYLGTKGDGNHFSYVGKMLVTQDIIRGLEDGGHYETAKALYPEVGNTINALVTHHGSRNFGAKIYKRGLDAAVKETALIAEGIPKTGAWLDLDTEIGASYWKALGYVGRWTSANHEVIHAKFLRKIGASPITKINNHHNAVWKHNGEIYHGKGATPAWKIDGQRQLGIIPLNMGREILLVSGNDNTDFLSFAPHGAGRNRSRTATIKPFINASTGKVNPELVAVAIAEETRGIEVVWASGVPDVSESPRGYKDATKIKTEIERYDLATVIGEITPLGCVMAGHIEPTWRKRKS